MDRDRIRRIARSYFEDGAHPAHDWNHVRRVETTAAELGARSGDVDEVVLELAVLLHDIGRPAEDAGEIDDHAEWGAREARAVLAEEGADEGTGEAVAHCVRAHRYSNDVEPESPEARVLCDADNLDALGAIGLARTFSYGAVAGAPIHDPDRPLEADDSPAGETSVNHLQKKILDLPERMYTDEGRALARDRAAFVEGFLRQFEAERAGER